METNTELSNMPILYTWDDSLPFRTELPNNVVFTFGANLLGRHGKGAAKIALDYFGARYGKGEGYHGQSYGIATKDGKLKVEPLFVILARIRTFIYFTRNNTNLRFFITPVGCGYAHYRPDQIAPMFQGLGDNCAIPLSWCRYFPGYRFIDCEL